MDWGGQASLPYHQIVVVYVVSFSVFNKFLKMSKNIAFAEVIVPC